VQSDEKLERLLLDQYQNLAVWSQLGFIRDDAVTGDADGRIQQFLQEAKRNTDVAQEFWVANAAGTVIASTLPSLRGRDVGDRDFLQAARRGESSVGSPTLHDLTGRVGMPIAFPLQASFDRSKPVGVIVAVLDWPKIASILQAVRVLPEGQDERGYLVLASSQGAILAAPPFLTGWEPGRTRLSSLGLEGFGAIVSDQAGSGVFDVRDASYLAGYATTEKRPYLPDAWRTILLMRTDVAFAPLGNLLWTIVVLSIVLGALAAAGSLYWATQFSRPIMSLVPFLKSVAAGDLSNGIAVNRNDELGMLADAANEMAGQLRKLLQDLQQASIQITGASTQVLNAAEDHASGSVEQAASIAQVTATMEELTNTAKQIAMSATSVEKIADDSAHAAHAGYDSVGGYLRQDAVAGRALAAHLRSPEPD
jgi:HAMP domain-containing protein